MGCLFFDEIKPLAVIGTIIIQASLKYTSMALAHVLEKMHRYQEVHHLLQGTQILTCSYSHSIGVPISVMFACYDPSMIMLVNYRDGIEST